MTTGTLVTSIKRYVGISTDTKPTIITDCPVGSTFYETDTGEMYIANAAATWVIKGDHVQLSESYPAQATPFTVTGDSGANAAQTITKAAEVGKSHYITAIEVVLTGAAAASAISVKLNDDVTTVWKSGIGLGSARGARTGFALSFPIKITAGKKADLIVDAGGAATVTFANMSGYTL